jgi:hypothetical protein
MEKMIRAIALIAVIASVFFGYKYFSYTKIINDFQKEKAFRDSVDVVIKSASTGNNYADYDSIKENGTSTILVYDIANPKNGVNNALVKIYSFNPSDGTISTSPCDQGNTDDKGKYISNNCSGLKGAFIIDVTSKAGTRTYRSQIRSISDVEIPRIDIGI